MFFRMRETAALPLLLIILLIKCSRLSKSFIQKKKKVKAKIIIKNSVHVSNEVSVSLAVSVV
jgi:hypothetical protein